MKCKFHFENININFNTMDFQYDNNPREVEWISKLIELKNTRTFCDIIISKGKTLLYAHSCILAAFSPFMLDLLRSFSQTEWSIFKPLKLSITYMTKCKKNSDMNCIGCVGKVIDYLYTGKILVEYSHVPHVINLSKNMQLLSLISVCQRFLSIEKNTDSKIPITHESEKEHCNEKFNTFNEVNGKNKNVPSFDQLCPEENNVCSETNKHVEEKTTMITADSIEDKTTIPTKSSITNKEVHLDVINYDMPLNSKSNNSVGNERGGEYHCVKCKLRFTCFEMFEAHKKVFHKRQFICLSCNFTTFKLSYIVYHLLNMSHEESCCSVCLFKAKDSNSLQLHLQDHKNDFPFKCYECGNLFKARTAWLRHMYLHNAEEKPHSSQICEVCGFVAPYESVMERHCLKHSKVNKTFTCPVIPCSFITYSKYNLKQHMLTHENEKCFICKVCSLKFSQEKNLKRHIQTLHEPKVEPYKCYRCNYKSARIDKMKEHCNSLHPGDDETLNSVLKQHKEKKFVDANNINNEDSNKNVSSEFITEDADLTSVEQKMGKTCPAGEDDLKQVTNSQMDLNEVSDSNEKKTFILSETTGEFNIISENEGEKIPVASVTSKNVLTIGNFREGTGSVTLNETTGILTFNNINSESTGAVFLNESTGELSYINLNKDSLSMDVEKPEPKYCREVRTQLNEFTGEMFTIDNERKLQDLNEEETLFDTFDMDIGNEDSCDGFDDLDGLLFDPIDIDGTNHIDLFISKNETGPLENTPHLNEATGELSFDMESQNSNVNIWKSNCSFQEEEAEDPYRLLLNEVTGEFS